MYECAGGLQPASPTPTPTRASASCVRLAAPAVRAVMPLQMKSASAMIVRRTPTSAQRAIGMPAKV